jgi:uncharacterized protein with NRDE domain
MCTLLFAYDVDPAHRLVIAANRDEFYGRRTAPLATWSDRQSVIAGRDLEGGGTWMGLSLSGRWAALTNVRRPRELPAPRSRGELVADFLGGAGSAMSYLQTIVGREDLYGGFNLVVGDSSGVYYWSNRSGAPPSAVVPGIHGLSNAALDTPWPKVERGKVALAAAVGRGAVTTDDLLELLSDRRGYADPELPDTGVGIAVERALAPLFVATPAYGTRSSTALLVGHDRRARISELTVEPGPGGRVDLEIDLA